MTITLENIINSDVRQWKRVFNIDNRAFVLKLNAGIRRQEEEKNELIKIFSLHVCARLYILLVVGKVTKHTHVRFERALYVITTDRTHIFFLDKY